MKVLHILRSNRFSGAENVVCQIVRLLKNDVDFVYCSRDGQIRNILNERNIKFAPVNSMSFKELKRVIREQKPDIIHAHDIAASILASLVCNNIPIISHVHVNNDDMSKINVKTILYLISSINYKHIFWVSKSCFDSFIFKKLVNNKSSILYNVIDKKDILDRARKDTTIYDYDIAYVGRLSYQKNPQKLMRVINYCIKNNRLIRVAIVGTGEFEEECKIMSTQYEISANIDFLGYMENPLKLLQSSKTMLMTSRFEGTPMVALEAMALGVPIVSTPTDGLIDLIVDGENGYLSSDEMVLSQLLLKIIQDEKCRVKMSKKSVEIFENMMNCSRYKDTILNVYKLYK